MFSIYSAQGRTFNGPLEELRRVAPSAGPSLLGRHPDTARETAARLAKERQHPGSHKDSHYRDHDDNPYNISQGLVAEYRQQYLNTGEREVIYHAYQIMSRPVIALRTFHTLAHAKSVFDKHSFRLMPVLNNNEDLVSTVSRRQLLSSIVDSRFGPQTLQHKISDTIMKHHHDVIAAEPVTELRRIAAVLIEQHLDAIPIVGAEKNLLGIVSRTDILKCMMLDPPISLWC